MAELHRRYDGICSQQNMAEPPSLSDLRGYGANHGRQAVPSLHSDFLGVAEHLQDNLASSDARHAPAFPILCAPKLGTTCQDATWRVASYFPTGTEIRPSLCTGKGKGKGKDRVSHSPQMTRADLGTLAARSGGGPFLKMRGVEC